ncbi:hypothetical protein Tcan_07118 [Toxocara canis]|uniref:Uncharacterized protein n=1 Tax=Toxocara canis TaxID=6265 RepID=A0A0B2VEV1_TOXCA|nr:hypothetical protein Tcan_07118 [Toxocara canis]
MRPIEGRCFWAFVKGTPVRKVDKPNEVDNMASTEPLEMSSGSIASFAAAHSILKQKNSAVTAAELLECLRSVISCEQVGHEVCNVEPVLYDEIATMLTHI